MCGRHVNPDELLPALGAVLQPDADARQRAERFLEDACKAPGCAVALLQIANAEQLDLGARAPRARHGAGVAATVASM